jgi:beta-RFAP synthase
MKMPETWRCHLLLPPGVRRSGDDESAFFESNTPVGEPDVLRVLAAVYHGICPAVAESDFKLLREALQQIQEVGFKRREVLGQPPAIRELIGELNARPYLAAGMSSMGPLIYVMEVCEVDRSLFVPELSAAAGMQYLGVFSLRNAGFEVS